MDVDLSDRVALITGSGRGNGRAIATTLAANGAKVIINDIEKEPAYKRQGVDLNDVPKEQKVSRTSLGEDSNDDLQLRSNNSFLHDNVD